MHYVPIRRIITESKFRGLAPELLANIFSSLPRRDLAHVVRVCKSFNLSGCLLLYQHIDLRSNDLYLEYTLDFLRGHESIDQKIVSAVLTTMPPTLIQTQQVYQWIAPDIAKRWINLRSLELRGYPFSNGPGSDRFVYTLHSCCHQLRRFVYRPGFRTLPDTFDLSRLQEIEGHFGQNDSDSDYCLPLNETMFASKNTITHISFVGEIRGEIYSSLHTFRFPCLRSLELGTLAHAENPAQVNTQITRFILDHPQITHLSLGKTRPLVENNVTNAHDLFLQFDGNHLLRDSLPLLRSFEGFLENITLLASHNVQSIFTLASLSIYCPYKDTTLSERLKQMVRAIMHADTTPRDQKFPFVRKLRLEFFTELHSMMEQDTTSLIHRECMDQFAELCPGVTSWYGRLPPMTSTHLGIMFGIPQYVETISLPWSTISIRKESEILEYFKAIAARCKHLKTVIARKSEDTTGNNLIYVLHRDRYGALSSVTVLPVSDDCYV
ncbi:hypothetical protein JR316_0012822 [Psilocybe cubensis]|uniref:Uncharacterized protein n=2 Tax=Psilocybe cubensis TaxID=181762 RepID=A0ACB8GH21_PSICU|nr:hypothetical protein JR316_0012822 [Psilocybe cubensis]KAH9474364.1 hypothetical protein JR316_0012822 [Psilocybe cubensis]